MTLDSLAHAQDQIVDKRFRLGRSVESPERAASGSDGVVYETWFGEEALPAAIRILPAESAEAGGALARWRSAAALSHPHLLRIYATGADRLENTQIVYLVTERWDETLAGVLSDRALGEADVREMLQPTLSALSYLHKNGCAHGALTPSRVLAVGDQLKLSTDSVTAISEGGSPPADMQWLGLLIVEALSRARPVAAASYALTTELRQASPVLAEIVQHCLEPDPAQRWTAFQAAVRLEAKEALPEASAAATKLAATKLAETKLTEATLPESAGELPAPQTSVPPRAAVSPPLAGAANPETAPVTKESAARAPWTSLGVAGDAGQEANDPETRAGWSSWIYGFVAIFVLVVLVFLFGRNKIPMPVAAPSRPAPVARELPAKPDTPAAPALRPEASSRPAPPSRVAARHASGWTVVVASYGSRGPAEKREQALAREWPRFHLSIFEHRADNGRTHYLVVLGQNLSQEEAANLRKRAVASGLPRDTYIKKFREQ